MRAVWGNLVSTRREGERGIRKRCLVADIGENLGTLCCTKRPGKALRCPKFQERVFLTKKAAGRPKPRQRGLANRICFYQNPQIPDPESPNLRIPKTPKAQIRKVENLDEKTIKSSRLSFFGKIRNWQIQNIQINSPLSTDRC